MNGQKQLPNQASQANGPQPINITNSVSHHAPSYSFKYAFKTPGEYSVNTYFSQGQDGPESEPGSLAIINRASDSVQGPSPFGSDVMSPLFAMPKSVPTPKSGTNGADGISQPP